MSQMFNPPHPGETLREDVLPALGLTVTDAAAQLGVTRAALSRVLNGRAAISPVMALRLEGWLGLKMVGMPTPGWHSKWPTISGKQGKPACQRLRQ